MGWQIDQMRRLAGISEPEFVARERELDLLTQALSRPGAVVLVEGEAGVGKSRLVRELLATLGTDQLPALVAVCPAYRESLTLGPVVDALRLATPEVRELGLSPLAGALRPVLPDWTDELPPSPEPLEDATAARHRLFRAFAELLDRLRVGVLVVEDVHWADPVTLEFLLFLIARQPPGPSLLVTYRPEEVTPGSLLLRLSSRASAGPNQARLSLDALDVDGTTRLVSSMLDGQPLSTKFATFLHRHTGGIPLAVEEVVRMMHDRADLIRRDGEWLRGSLVNIRVPPTIRDAVLERVSRLPDDAQEVLRAAAVLAEPADEATLTAVSGLPADRARAGLAAALDSRLLQEGGAGQVSYRHLLNCWAVYESIAAPHRRALHLRAGRALESHLLLPLMRLVRHFREAGALADWCRYAEQAADRAMASGDEEAACSLLHDLVVHGSQPVPAMIRLLGKIPYTLFFGLDRFRGLAATLRTVLDQAVLRPEEEGELRYYLGRVLTHMEIQGARVELERAIPLLTRNPQLAARAMLTLGWPRGATTTAAQHRRWLQRAVELTPQLTAADRLHVIVENASALLMLGEEAGWAQADLIPEDADLVEQRREIARAGVNIADMAMRWGRYPDAERWLARGVPIVERYQYLRFHAVIQCTRVHLDFFTGGWSGLAERVESLAMSEHLMPVCRLESMMVFGLLRAAGGAAQEAEERLRTALDESTRHQAPDVTVEAAAALARLWLADGRVADALAVTEDPIAVVRHKQTWLWAAELGPARVAALLAAGRDGEAVELVAEMERGAAGLHAPALRAGLLTAQAVLAEGRGAPPASVASRFARAAQAWDRLPRPYDALLARERQAASLLADGRTDDGVALLSTVFAGLAELGARGDAMRVMHSLRQQGVEVRRPWWGGRHSYGVELSPRELDVARLVIDGRTNREIAEALFLSPKTVARHLNSAMRKIDVTTRTALAVRLLESGTVPTKR